ncbi:MAG TPA: hypothetical protein DGG94_14830 [Micromonosporaceae bacterium]|nr:hypothetical protein [Micromonosporaceae bacterium]
MRLAHRSHGYLLDIDPDLVDAHRFTGLIARGRELHGRDEQRTSVLRQALDLWRGVPLAGMHGEWVMQVREAWRRQRLEAITMWARSEIRIGNIGAVIGPLTAIVAEEPLVEPLAAELMRALHTAGMSAEALTCYRHLRQRLAEELGIEPGADVQELHRLILKGSPESLSLVAQPVHSLDVPRQLPAAARTFIGRPQELQRLAELARQADRTNTVVILAIDGAAGVGKTSLAVHFGHQVAGRYPDGQLYLNLRGFDPSGTLLDPSTAVQMLLEALGVAPQRIPSILDAQSALLRSRLAGRRMLLVLDNARDAEQVRPLLPGTPGCLVLITSRHQLTSLCMSEGAELITIGLLSTVEARELLAARLGAERVGREPEAVAEIIARCGNLPLALVMVAARAAANPRLNLAAVVTALTETSTLDALDDIVSVFSWSYLGISAAAARLFRLLGLHPGPDVSIEAAASLAAEPISNTRLLLAQLTRAHLISEGPAGRYSFHDLVRQFASQQAQRLESHAERTAAVERLLDHYLHAAHVADHLIDPHGDLLTLPAPKTGAFLTAFHDQQQAIRWFAEDRRVLLALVGHAADSGWNSHVYHLDRVVTRSLFRSEIGRAQVTTPPAADRKSTLLNSSHRL